MAIVLDVTDREKPRCLITEPDVWKHRCAYVVGWLPPKYPVPAIRQGFEYIRNCRTGKVHLMHWEQEAV